jgi:hypothetical protein
MLLGYAKGKPKRHLDLALPPIGHWQFTEGVVSELRHSSLIVMKLENYGPTGESLNNNH